MSTELMKWIRQPKPFKSLYFVIGTEPFFLSEIKKTFKKQLLSQAADFNQDEVFAGETPLGDILTLFETLPLLSKRRLLLCHQAERFSEKDWRYLSSVLSQNNDSTVFVCFFDKKDGRKKHFKFLGEKGIELSAKPLKNWELAPWLDFLSQREALKFSSSARLLFQELLGSNLMEIQIELKKLKHYLGEKERASEEDVLACTSRLKIDSLFDLTDALGSKNIVKALHLLARLLEQNQSEIAVLSLLSRHIRILSQIKLGQKEKLRPAQLANKAGVSPYFLKNYLKQAALWSEEQIEGTIQALFLTDKALKSSPLSSHIWLENFILKSCS